MPEFTIVETTDATPYLYADGRASWEPDAISRAMGEAFGKVAGFLEERGLSPAGPALSVYQDYDPEALNFRAGFVAAPADLDKASGHVAGARLPVGRALRFVHEGPYATLRDDYALAEAWIAAEGLNMGDTAWELYLNDADRTPERDLRTEVHILLD